MNAEEATLLLRQSKTTLANAVAAVLLDFIYEEYAEREITLTGGNVVKLIMDWTRWRESFSGREQATLRLRASKAGIAAAFQNIIADFICNETSERIFNAVGGGQVKLTVDFTRWPERIEVRVN